MRFHQHARFLLVAFVATLAFSFVGCQQQQEAEGPELGAIEAYLEEHPEERVDNPDEAGSEEEEFEAGS